MLICVVDYAGWEAELYYIRDDLVQEAATRYDMAIKTDINSLYFNWRTQRQVRCMKILYTTCTCTNVPLIKTVTIHADSRPP